MFYAWQWRALDTVVFLYEVIGRYITSMRWVGCSALTPSPPLHLSTLLDPEYQAEQQFSERQTRFWSGWLQTIWGNGSFVFQTEYLSNALWTNALTLDPLLLWGCMSSTLLKHFMLVTIFGCAHKILNTRWLLWFVCVSGHPEVQHPLDNRRAASGCSR